jgi:hypothetical protein
LLWTSVCHPCMSLKCHFFMIVGLISFIICWCPLQNRTQISLHSLASWLPLLSFTIGFGKDSNTS